MPGNGGRRTDADAASPLVPLPATSDEDGLVTTDAEPDVSPGLIGAQPEDIGEHTEQSDRAGQADADVRGFDETRSQPVRRSGRARKAPDRLVMS